MGNKQSKQQSQKKTLIKPAELLKIKDLFIVAKGVVEGFVTGNHKSNMKGFSLEFAEYRKYVHGDEIKHIDWKIFAKTQKYFVKQFEAETNMKVYIALDRSASMNYIGKEGFSKFDYSKSLAAALTYLVAKQQDLIGLLTFNNQINHYMPSGNSLLHTRKIIEHLTNLTAEGSSNLTKSLHSALNRIKRRALIIIISDLFDNSDDFIKIIKHIRHAKHEVLVFHMLDNSEITFPFTKMTTFNDIESNSSLTIDPLGIREEYLKAITNFQSNLRVNLNKQQVPYISVNTMIPFEYVLAKYLSKRKTV